MKLFMLTPEFLRFLMAGGVAAAANFGSRFLFSNWVSYPVAIVLAYLVGMVIAFLLMRTYVFSPGANVLGVQLVRFVGVNLLAVLQTLVISVVLARWALPAMGIHAQAEALAHLVGVVVPVVTSYFGHKLATFR
jgi:putative flippase GtrA